MAEELDLHEPVDTEVEQALGHDVSKHRVDSGGARAAAAAC